jgi:putative flippase GtrA
MRKILKAGGKGIRGLIDIFYPPFKKYMSIQLFRYGATGAANLMFDWVLYFFLYNFVIQHRLVHLGIVTLSPHIAAFLFTFPISFMTGFLLQKYVTFSASYLRGRVQLVRYGMVVAANLILNYVGLKILVDALGWYPTPSKMLITLIATGISYLSQKKYTFK